MLHFPAGDLGTIRLLLHVKALADCRPKSPVYAVSSLKFRYASLEYGIAYNIQF